MNKNKTTKLHKTKCEILNKEMVAPDTALLQIKGELNFKPGQFIKIYLDHFGSVVVAPCSSPTNKKFFEICVKGHGSTTNNLIKSLPGDFVTVSGPYGNFWRFENFVNTNYLIITGGLGMVPLRPFLFEIERRKILLSKIKLIAGFRSPDHVLFSEDLKRWHQKFKSETYVEFGHKNSTEKIGSVIDGIRNCKINPDNAIALICGPEIMYQPVLDELSKFDLPERQIFLSLERHMECGTGLCQHCSCGKYLVCKDGPIFRYDKIKTELNRGR